MATAMYLEHYLDSERGAAAGRDPRCATGPSGEGGSAGSPRVGLP